MKSGLEINRKRKHESDEKTLEKGSEEKKSKVSPLSVLELKKAVDNCFDNTLDRSRWANFIENLNTLETPEIFYQPQYTFNNVNLFQYLLFKFTKSKSIKSSYLPAEEALNKIIDLIIIKLTSEQRKELLYGRTFAGFGILQQVITSGSEIIFDKIVFLLREPEYEAVLCANLENFTRDGFGVLPHAIKTESEPIFTSVLSLLKKPEHKYALSKNLENITRDGFGVLLHAIATGSKAIFTKLLSLLEEPEHKHALDKNLENFNKDYFGVLVSAIKSRSKTIFNGVFSVLQKHKHALSKNLENITRDGFGVLHYAINSGSESIFNDVFSVLQKHKHALSKNLESFTENGFGVLQQAINSGSESIFNDVFSVLQKPEHKHALSKNLENFTENNFGVLVPAIRSGSESIFNDVFSVLQKPEHERALNKNLENFTKDGFGVLESAIKSGSEFIFTKVLSLLEKPEHERGARPPALSKNLENFTENGFGALLSSIKSGSELIFTQVLSLLKKPEHKQALYMNLTIRNKYGYNPLWSAMNLLSDSSFNELIHLSKDNLPNEEWKKVLHSPKNLVRQLLSAKIENLGKIKMCLNLLRQVFGEKQALNLLENTFDSSRLFTDQLKEQYRALIKNSNYVFQNREKLLQSVLTIFSPSEDNKCDLNKIPFLQERTFDCDDLIYRDTKNKSLLWCMACAAAFGQPGFLIKQWGKHSHRFILEDISQREGQEKKGKSVLWFLLYAYKNAYKNQINNGNLEEIVREVWQRFPSAFDLKYLPKDEESPNRSIEGLLSQMGSLGEDILLELKPLEERKPLPLEEKPLPSQYNAGIADKYLFGAMPALPKKRTLPKQEEKSTLSVLLKQCFQTKEHGTFKRFEINEEGFSATFYSAFPDLEALKSKNITFVCAGRKNKARVPFPKEGLVVWVIAPEEYEEVKNLIPKKQSILVINKLSSELSGEFTQLHLITARRLAIFLFAHTLRLNHFIMLDDNIEKLLLQGTPSHVESNWDTVYEKIMGLQKEKGTVCVSVPTHTLQKKETKLNQLGSKLFFFNTAMLKSLSLKEMFLLLPSACDAHLWGEDYYFQLMLEKLFPQCGGYQVVSKEEMSLVRSKQDRNLFLTSVQKNKTAVAQRFTPPSFLEALLYPAREWVMQKMNEIIESNTIRAREKRNQLERIDLLGVHAKANFHSVGSDVGNPLSERKMDFKQFIKEMHFIDGAHYPHQIEAIKSIAHMKETAGQLILATGTGKTRIQCELARIAYHLAGPGQSIIIITPQLALVEQFYTDFIQFSQTKTADMSLAVPKSAIMKVSSAYDSVNVNALLVNKVIKRQKCILIFCEKSFKSFLPHWKEYHPSLCLLDEFHDYEETTHKVISIIPTYRLGLSATPPTQCFSQTLYRFSILEALRAKRLTPVVIDKIDNQYSAQSVDPLIKMLPTLLERAHPCAADPSSNVRLRDVTGIIYLPSIADCEKARHVLLKNAIPCYVIHSGNKRSQEEVEEFKRQSSGVLLACHMLRMGFDHRPLGYEIIAQAVANDQTLTQMVGRVMRLDGAKLGNVITFRDIAKRVKGIVGTFTEKPSLNPGYEALPDREYFRDKASSGEPILLKKKTLKQKRLQELERDTVNKHVQQVCELLNDSNIKEKEGTQDPMPSSGTRGRNLLTAFKTLSTHQPDSLSKDQPKKESGNKERKKASYRCL